MRLHTIESAQSAYAVLQDNLDEGLKSVKDSINKKWANLSRQLKSQKELSGKLIGRVDKMEKSLTTLTNEIRQLRSNPPQSLPRATDVGMSLPVATDPAKSSTKLPRPRRRRTRPKTKPNPPDTPSPSPTRITLPPALPIGDAIAGRTRAKKRQLKAAESDEGKKEAAEGDEKEAAESDEDEPPRKRQRTSSKKTTTIKKKKTTPAKKKKTTSAKKKKTTPAKKKKNASPPSTKQATTPKKKPATVKEKATTPKKKGVTGKKKGTTPKKTTPVRPRKPGGPGGMTTGPRLRHSARLKKKKRKRESSGSDSECMTTALFCVVECILSDFTGSPDNKKRRTQEEADERDEMEVDGNDDELQVESDADATDEDMRDPLGSENDESDDDSFDPNELRKQAVENNNEHMPTAIPPWEDIAAAEEYTPLPDEGAFLHDYDENLSDSLKDRKKRMLSFFHTDKVFVFKPQEQSS